jgi:hypothetical protein
MLQLILSFLGIFFAFGILVVGYILFVNIPIVWDKFIMFLAKNFMPSLDKDNNK